MRAILVALLLAGCAGAPMLDLAEVEARPPAWGEAGSAVIRPGVQFTTLGPPALALTRGGCTAAFLFYAANGSALLSTAAHCLGPDRERLSIANGAAYGKAVYCSFEANGGPCATERTSGDPNDFGLVLLDPADVARANPSVLGIGGPTGIAPCAEVQPGTPLLLYGNSSFKPDARPARVVRGEAQETLGAFSFMAKFDVPAVPADSGSPVLHADGRAVGVMRALHTDGRNEIVCLDAALAAVEALSPWRVTLATAPVGEEALS